MKVINTNNQNLIIDKSQNEPIILVYDLKKENEKSLSITVKKDISVSIIELFLDGNRDQELEFKREFNLEENTKLNYLKYQDANSLKTLNLNYIYNLKESSKLYQTNLEFGEVTNTNTYESKLINDNVLLEISGLVKINSKVHSSSSFNITHIAESCTSDVKYKHSLNGFAKASFKATSIVEHSANFSKVFQNTDTILLSDDASIFAQPHLLIDIDELEASHGATTGTLDEEQLLYLRSRGINEELANELLLKAFENEVFDNIQDNKIKDFLNEFNRSEYV